LKGPSQIKEHNEIKLSLGEKEIRVVISYARKDIKIAEKLENDLKDQNIGIWIDKQDIKPGSIWLENIDKALYELDYVLGVVTEHYLSSIGGIEAYATITKGLKERNFNFIPLFFINPENLKSVIIPAISGFLFYENYNQGFLELIKFLKSEEKENAKELLSKIESIESPNPFRRVRAEYFDDYKQIALAFAEPEKELYDRIRESMPIIIFGGRGSGKTMILKSLIPEVNISRLKAKSFKEVKEKGINFFGIYHRLKKGSFLIYDYDIIVRIGFLNTNMKFNYDLYKNLINKLENNEIDNEPIIAAGINSVGVISLNEFNFKILNSTIKQLQSLQEENFISIDRNTEALIVKKITENMNLNTLENIRTFDDLTKSITNEICKISDYIQNLVLPYASPEPNWRKTGTDFLDGFFEILKNNIPDLKGTYIYLLFDEFENIKFFQQIIINEWIKTANNYTIKIASKFEGHYTNQTLQGQALQDGQDYKGIELDYNLFDTNIKSNYQNLLVKICKNLLSLENYKIQNIREILEEPEDLELPREVVIEEIKNMRQQANLTVSEDKINDYLNHLKIPAIFRLLRKKRTGKTKRYAGFETYTYLSFGIIRIFLNLVGMAFYKAEEEGYDIKNGAKIPIETQTWAAYVTSKAWLEKIPSNLEKYGERMYQFIVDIGDTFRERLLFNLTNPETITIRIKDPYNLKPNTILNKLLSHSVKESILYERKETSSMKPKATTISRAKEFVLNRIYSPVLEISYSPRWPRASEFTTSELMKLLDPAQRNKIKRILQRRQHKAVEKIKPLSEFLGETD